MAHANESSWTVARQAGLRMALESLTSRRVNPAAPRSSFAGWTTCPQNPAKSPTLRSPLEVSVGHQIAAKSRSRCSFRQRKRNGRLIYQSPNRRTPNGLRPLTSLRKQFIAATGGVSSMMAARISSLFHPTAVPTDKFPRATTIMAARAGTLTGRLSISPACLKKTQSTSGASQTCMPWMSKQA